METVANKTSLIDLSAVMEAMPDALVIVDHKGQIILVNQQTENLFDYQRVELLGEYVEFLMPIRFRKKHPTDRENYFSNPRVRPMGIGLELFGLKKNGIEFPIEISLSPLKTEEGIFALAAVRDITARKKVEDKFKAILESTPDCLIMINKNGEITLANAVAEKIFGYKKKELIGRKVESLMPQRFGQQHVRNREQYFQQPRIRPMGAGLELYGLHKDGHEFPVEISLSPLETEEGTLALAAVRDISDRKKIEDMTQMLSAIVQSSSDAIIGKDLNGIITSWNKGAEQLYGYSANEVIGQSITILFPPDQKNEFTNILSDINSGHSVKFDETFRIHKTGDFVPVSVVVSPIKNAQGKIVGASTTARDIRVQKELKEKLQSKNIELENANLTKDRFLANMSHELRTPLNAIIGFTGILLMELAGPLNNEQTKQLTTIDESAKHLLSLINDILDLAKIESGKIEIILQPVDCVEIIQTVLTTMQPLASSKQLELKFNPPPISIYTQTDKRALTQILINLIGNAIKFTNKGSVFIELKLKNINQQEYIVIDIIDTGVGISHENEEKLFKAFEQLKNPNKIPEGTGLGLYLSKKLMSLINGKIEFKSTFGKGSCFSIIIPKG